MTELPAGVALRGPHLPAVDRILTPEALTLLADLHRRFDRTRNSLLAAREATQARFDAGALPDFPAETAAIRTADWTIASLPADLLDRRVEITGPVDRKMVINALNSGAKMFMADFEDATCPTWTNQLEGQVNLADAIRRTITFEHPTKGTYRLVDEPAVLLVRPRGLHLPEAHLTVDGEPVSGSLFDAVLYLFHNAAELLARGSGPYLYLPKLEHYLEARWWNDVFVAVQDALGIPQGSIKATVLVETLPASFQLDEILYELKDHSAGLNCGRWDYIFSAIKTMRAHKDFVLPDRSAVGMTQPMMAAYTQRVVAVCHRREAPAMGGMAAQIPIKRDAEAHTAAMEKVRRDKLREVTEGHDGTWVAHPALVAVAQDVFDAHMPQPNQIDRQVDASHIGQAELLAVPTGPKTEEGVRINLRVGVQYLAAWLGGMGCVPLYDLMEDAATAEISRAALWAWRHHAVTLDDGRTVDDALIDALFADELASLRAQLGDAVVDSPAFTKAVTMFTEMVTAPALDPFLTTPAYAEVLTLTDEESSR